VSCRTPLAAARFIHSRMAGAALTVPDAAHISNVEQPVPFADAVLEFLAHRR
jgi:3-oxoadipate enol-lactonase